MVKFEIVSCSEKMTEDLGGLLAKSIDSTAFIAIDGEMGAGKTAFSRGFAAALGERASSPTFAIANEYASCPRVTHFDVYRLTDYDELLETGYDWEDIEGITIVEWASKFKNDLPDNRIEINIRKISEERRMLEFTSYGQAHSQIMEMFINAAS